MCCKSETLKDSSCSSEEDNNTNMNDPLSVEGGENSASLLEFAANNDVKSFRASIERYPALVDEVGLWYGRQKGSKTMVNDQRTPLMVAATYGSVDVIRLILSSSSEADVNRTCGNDKTTALHCAASGGAVNALDVVKLLLTAGADPSLSDENGHRAGDVIVVPPKLEGVKLMLQELLNGSTVNRNLRVLTSSKLSDSPPDSPALGHLPTEDSYSPLRSKSTEAKKEYLVDPSLPDIKNSVYSTDEFRMYSFKVRPCSRAYSHDWTECPFVHPGENARRRDPRKYHYSCVPCPEFRKGMCRRGDMCEYAHGVFECWLHPAQYRTRLCKDGTSCARRVCFFAHRPEELRPLYVSTGSAVMSPRSTADFAAAMSLLPGSPSSVSVMSPSGFTPPMSPSGANGSSMAWPQPNVPALHLPGNNLQSSRLRSSFNARDIPADELRMLADFDQQQQLLNELSLSRSGRFKSLTPSNLDDLFSADNTSSPRFADQSMASVFSPTRQSAVFNAGFSPTNVDHARLQASFGGGRMSPRNTEPILPISSRVSMLGQHEKHQFRSLSSRELGSHSNSATGSPSHSWSKWGSPNGNADWGVNTEDSGKLRRSSSLELGNGDEPDVSWVQSLVRESPSDEKGKASSVPPVGTTAGGSSLVESQVEAGDDDHAVLGGWIGQLQLDQLVALQN